jgi:hypothetical protein
MHVHGAASRQPPYDVAIAAAAGTFHPWHPDPDPRRKRIAIAVHVHVHVHVTRTLQCGNADAIRAWVRAAS